nr:nucleotidyltransferase domain-containing protein [Ruegeria sp. HKCCD8929]
MVNGGLSDQDKQEITRWAERQPIIRRVILFGSRARGTQHANSDFDLAIQVFPSSPHHLAQLANMDWKDRRIGELEKTLQNKVHLEWYAPCAGLAIERSIKDEGVTVFFRQTFTGASA